MIVNILQNWSHRYCSHYIIIKCIGFEPNNYNINLDLDSSSKVFNEFDFVFLSNVLLV